MRILLTLCVCLSLSTLHAQKLDHRLGYMILQVKDKSHLDAVRTRQSEKFRSPVNLEKVLSNRLGIYLLSFDHSRIHERKLLDGLRADRQVIVAQYDHITTPRNLPDDPLFSDQWQWFNTGQTGGTTDSDIDADLAWDISRGGVTAKGDTIVVAIIDDGLDYNHPDIAANTWINYNEIPENGIDDDSNGYVDDVYGWNAYSENGEILNQGHGLAVAGMIGAVGNNAIGITGINWNVKLMTIVGGTPESSVIASYSYALEQRALYHETNGSRGAFVVSTNSSWGIDFGNPADAPLWCAFYDSLGVHGIISAAATSNIGYDVDSLLDLPTACPSEFLLSVTALNHTNIRTFSAFGKEHVDFGAPGDNIFTTRGNNDYGNTSGTSFASPVAAGLVALLYSAPCFSVAELAHSDPEAGARYIRDLIFQGVEKIPALENETRFGGALNAGNSMELLMALCSECPIPFGINSNIISDTEVILDWITIDTPDAINARFKPVAASDWDTLSNVSSPLTLTGLIGCTDYVIEFEAICADTSTGFQVSHSFKTDGCCELPASISVTANESSFHASWSHVLAAEYYLIQWKKQSDTEWMEEVTSLDEVTILNLEPCTYYQFRLQTNCDTTLTGFSDTITFRTRNCGLCIDLPYCEAGSDDSSEEFLDSLIIGSLVNHSGQDGGYRFFEDLSAEFNAGDTLPVFLRPGFGTFQNFDEQFRIWLDVNQDGVFEENELLLDSVLSENDTVLISEMAIPENALAGGTRMRVSMAFHNPPFLVDQEPCGEIEFGEIEDYCVTILRDQNTCPRVDTVLFDAINFTGAFMYWPSAEGAIAYTYRYRLLGSSEDYTELATVDTTAVIEGLSKCNMYEFQIRTVCIEDTTSYDSIYVLETDCDVAVDPVDPLLANVHLFPNPVTDYVNVRIEAIESGEYHLSVYNLHGQSLYFENVFVDQGSVTDHHIPDLNQLLPGLYIVVIEKDGRRSTHKMVKL